MMNFKKIIFTSIISLLIMSSCYYNGNKETSKRVFNELVGTFSLDLNKTNFGRYSSEQYKGLQITFKNDSSFVLNMQVPFIYDSAGKWIPTKGGLEDWNWLFYRSNTNISTQFSEVWTKDSIFYLNSATPKNGEDAIPKIYFKKIRK